MPPYPALDGLTFLSARQSAMSEISANWMSSKIATSLKDMRSRGCIYKNEMQYSCQNALARFQRRKMGHSHA